MRMGWVSSKVITRVISLGIRTSEPKHRQYSPKGTPQNSGGIGVGVAVCSRKPVISLKGGKIGPRLLLLTNRKSHTRFRLVPKSVDDLQGPFRSLFQNTCVFGAHHENLNEDIPTVSAAKM